MPTLSIITSDSDEPVVFENVPADDAQRCVDLLRHDGQVLRLTPRNGGTAYIPVRNITYLHVADEEN